MDKLIAAGIIEPAIVVGIDNTPTASPSTRRAATSSTAAASSMPMRPSSSIPSSHGPTPTCAR
jgi:enterochelin esterase-like enzyme